MLNNLKKYLNKSLELFRILGFKKIIKINPKNNWILVIIIFLIINILLISDKIFQLYRPDSNETLLTKDFNEEVVDTIDHKGLNETISRFELRNENYKSLKANRPRFSDPSI
jgi:hypothetical protein